ncbi:MAG: carboxypeptidase-like regulatory domain-containing protein [Crocinitomicaceae bacterium]|nr:carboxypeptidase-like regulatory domain-containing protein [Crocinitomicaceae bacterium]
MPKTNVIFVLATLFIIGAPSFAQTSLTVSGSVVNYAGAPIFDAYLRLEPPCTCGWSTLTDKEGNYTLDFDSTRGQFHEAKLFVWVEGY